MTTGIGQGVQVPFVCPAPDPYPSFRREFKSEADPQRTRAPKGHVTSKLSPRFRFQADITIFQRLGEYLYTQINGKSLVTSCCITQTSQKPSSISCPSFS